MLDKSIPHIGVLMVKTDTSTYPCFELPNGFALSGYQEGYETEWANLMFDIGQTDTLKEAQDIFEKEFLSMPSLLAKQCLFALDHNGRIVATASLWHGEHFGKTFQRIHWVASCPQHQGKGLIKALLTKLLDVYNEFCYKDFIYLTSQTWSYKALNIYAKFGFKPYKGEKPINWKDDTFEEKNETAWTMIEQKIELYERMKREIMI